MGVTSVTESLTGTRSGRRDRLFQGVYRRSFIVETDDPVVGPVAAILATGIPRIGDIYTNGVSGSDPNFENDLGSFVQQVEATMDGDGAGLQWTVTVDYGPYDTSTFGDNPVDWPIKVIFGGERTDRVLYFDRTTGDPITNSAGDPFDPPITVDDSRPTMVIYRNELVSSFDIDLASVYSNSINNATWNGFAAYKVKLGEITTSEPQFNARNQIYYYTVAYPCFLNRNGWKVSVLDQGCNELTGDPGSEKPGPIMNEGQQVSDPVPLDGSGHRLAIGDSPVTLEFDGYDELDFSGLSLDLSLRLGA